MIRNKTKLFWSCFSIVAILTICIICFNFPFLSPTEVLKIEELEFSKREKIQEYVGNYEFSEHYPNNINMIYKIEIRKEGEKHYAYINVDGFQTLIRFKADVVENDVGVSLILKEKLYGDLSSKSYVVGDTLLNFSKNDVDLITTWHKLKPMLKENLDNLYTFTRQDS